MSSRFRNNDEQLVMTLWCKTAYREINLVLNGQLPHNVNEKLYVYKRIKLIYEFIRRNNTTLNILLYRGGINKTVNGNIIGDIINEKGFVSYSKDLNIAYEFQHRYGTVGKFIGIIDSSIIPSNCYADISDINAVEKEVLLLPGYFLINDQVREDEYRLIYNPSPNIPIPDEILQRLENVSISDGPWYITYTNGGKKTNSNLTIKEKSNTPLTLNELMWRVTTPLTLSSMNGKNLKRIEKYVIYIHDMHTGMRRYPLTKHKRLVKSLLFNLDYVYNFITLSPTEIIRVAIYNNDKLVSLSFGSAIPLFTRRLKSSLV